MRQSKKRFISGFFLCISVIALILFGVYVLKDRSYYFISFGILILTLFFFALSYEKRRPQTREILLSAVMISLAVAGRAAFFMIPQFKPMAAVIIITGICLGAQAGFLTGAFSAFVSNFFFGQGPWTPWQMFAFGLIGLLAGVVFRGQRNNWKESRVILCTFGGSVVLVLYGIIMDTASALMYMNPPTGKGLMAVYLSGFPFNVIHAVSTVFFLAILGNPMFRKIDRIKRRYGLME